MTLTAALKSAEIRLKRRSPALLLSWQNTFVCRPKIDSAPLLRAHFCNEILTCFVNSISDPPLPALYAAEKRGLIFGEEEC